MKRYLVKLSGSMWGVNLELYEFAALEAAISAVERAANKRFQQKSGGVHQAGWPYVTLHQTVAESVAVTGMLLAQFDPTIVATIYEIEIQEGQTTQDIYRAWYTEQERAKKEARRRELEAMQRDALAHFPVQLLGRICVRQYEDSEGYEMLRLYIGDPDEWADLEGEILALLGNPELRSVSEIIALGNVRITIERVESADDDE